MPRWNYSSRNRILTEKKPSIQVQHERVFQFLDVVLERGEIKEFDLQRILGFGPGVFERIARIIKTQYNDEISFNKKTREYQYKKEFLQKTNPLNVLSDLEQPEQILEIRN